MTFDANIDFGILGYFALFWVVFIGFWVVFFDFGAFFDGFGWFFVVF